jgi:hypothetical protein
MAQQLAAVYYSPWIGPTEERARLNEVLALDGGDPASNARALVLQRSAFVARNQGDLWRDIWLCCQSPAGTTTHLPHPQLSQWAGGDRDLARTVRAGRSVLEG